MIGRLPLGLLLGLSLAAPADAAVRRVAVLVGNNEGRVSDQALYFAERDAEKMREALTELGGFERGDVQLLLGRGRGQVLSAMVEAREAVERARGDGDEVIFLFYYSGHADDEGLQLGNTWLRFDELEALVDRTEADVRLAFVDACNSGELTRDKGGVRAPSFVFDVSERLGAAGTVIITSSSEDEASQESDEIGGSYFTYYLVGGLYGAADRNGDGVVTLGESYDYVYRETVLRTSGTRSGAQHPTFEWDLSGEADVVLSELDPAGSRLVFPAALEGAYAVFDVERRSFVGEVEAGEVDRALAVRPGRYLIQRRYPTHLLVADVRIDDGAELDVAALDFEPLEYEDDLAKGAIDKQIAAARRPHTTLRLLFGITAPSREDYALQYFPGTGLAGAGLRYDKDQLWGGLDISSGTWTGTILPAQLPVDARFTYADAGVELGWASRPRALRVGGGLRFAGVYLRRDFDAEQEVPSDFVLTASPGLVAWAGWWPGRLQLDLDLRLMYLPYDMDGQRGFAVSERYLGAGWRF